jgi:hypothetical protein
MPRPDVTGRGWAQVAISALGMGIDDEEPPPALAPDGPSQPPQEGDGGGQVGVSEGQDVRP